MSEYDIPDSIENLIEDWIDSDLTLEFKAEDEMTGNIVWICFESNVYYAHHSNGRSHRKAGDKRRLELISDDENTGNLQRKIRDSNILSQEIRTNRPDVMKRQLERLTNEFENLIVRGGE